MRVHRLLAATAVCALVSMPLLPGAAGAPTATRDVGTWAMYGYDAAGSRTNPAEHALGARAVRHLHVAWRFAGTGGPVYGTPAVAAGVVYDADLAGEVFALDAHTGALRWLTHVSVPATFPAGITGSPALTATDVIVGDQNGFVWALDRRSGVVHWAARPNRYLPAIWGSPTVADVRVDGGWRTLVLVPVASNEETYTATGAQPCCMARGSVAALDARTGAVVWQTYTITPEQAAVGAAGASVWSSPSYDAALNTVFVATGNNFANRDGTATTSTSDAVLALDAATGAIRWVNQRTPRDTYVTAYHEGPAHPDYDFGDSPDVFRLHDGRPVVAVGQKSGYLYVLDARSGRVVDQRQLLPAGELGGFFADSAEHGGVVFGDGNDWTAYGGGETGGLAGLALSAVTGGNAPPRAGEVVAAATTASGRLRLRWRFTTPGRAIMAAVAVADGLVWVNATQTGDVVALDEKTGRVRAKVHVGPSLSGPAIAGGRVYVGYGETFGYAGTDPTNGGVVSLAP